MGRGIDLTGRKFGKLTVVDQAPNKEGQRGNWWNCLCDCGNAKVASAKSLNAGDTQSCGCLNKNDLIGKVYGRLTVKAEGVEKKSKKRTWVCECSCGSTSIATTSDLVTGHTRSCGCLQKEKAKEVKTTHGLRKHPLYGRWLAIKNRCYNPKDEYYHNYGGRGIGVCDRWRNSFPNFLKDMGDCPEGYSIDRRDNDKDYSPENCRWVDTRTQGRNKSDTVWLKYRGEKVKRIELAERHGVEPNIFRQRLDKGWDIELALTPPIPPRYKTWGVVVCVNLETRVITFAVNTAGLEEDFNLSRHKVKSAATYKIPIDNLWLIKEIDDDTPWSDFKASNPPPEDVILKQANEPDIIFSNVREAYRYLERCSLLDKEYTLKVFE